MEVPPGWQHEQDQEKRHDEHEVDGGIDDRLDRAETRKPFLDGRGADDIRRENDRREGEKRPARLRRQPLAHPRKPAAGSGLIRGETRWFH